MAVARGVEAVQGGGGARALSSAAVRARVAAWVRDGVVPYWRIVRLLPAVDRRMSAALWGLVLVGAALPVGRTVAAGLLVGSVPAALAGGPGSPEVAATFTWLGVVGVLFVVGRVVGTVRALVGGLLGRRTDEHLRERVMRAINRPTGVAHLEDPALRDQMERAQGLMGRYSTGSTVNPLAGMAGLWLQSMGCAAVLAPFNAPLALALLATWGVAAHVLRREYVQSYRISPEATKAARRANYLSELAIVPGAGKELRVWGMVDWLTARFTEAMQRRMALTWADRDRGQRLHALAGLASQSVSFVALAAIGAAGARGEIGLAALATYIGAVGGVSAMNAWGSDSFQLMYGTAALPAVEELERRMGESEAQAALRGTVSPMGMPREGIRLEGVAFRYPGRDGDALAGVDLFIPAGRSLAIVGANGAGKTTLVKLIARLYDTTGGRISVDGVDLRDLEPRAWQRRVSAIFQDFIQYHLTARENVALGAVERAGDEAALLDAARRSGALEVIERLPLGWETRLSRQYKGGADLSGGQWQRLALARALFAVSAGAGVLILDEPTANLDVRAEAALYERFLDITQGLTTIVISHRFSTVRRADRIVVLEDGRVAEEGTHEELMALGGRYAEMFTLQAQRFEEVGSRQ